MLGVSGTASSSVSPLGCFGGVVSTSRPGSRGVVVSACGTPPGPSTCPNPGGDSVGGV